MKTKNTNTSIIALPEQYKILVRAHLRYSNNTKC